MSETVRTSNGVPMLGLGVPGALDTGGELGRLVNAGMRFDNERVCPTLRDFEIEGESNKRVRPRRSGANC